MDRSRHNSTTQAFEHHTTHRKPSLPNFSHFVLAAGHPDLAYRGPLRLDAAFTSPPTGQASLPTPPSTSGQHFGWLKGEIRQNYSEERQCAIIDDHDIYPIDRQRRLSFTQPDQILIQPRLSRAHSSVLESSNREAWQHGRVMNEREVPGKGTCYVYDDGTICPKQVNGDVVNPKWGTTKAGKPRKRLGQACNACRDKKIRCDPQAGYPKCAQCSRGNRECQFSDGSRQGHRSPKFRTSTDSPIATDTSVYSPTNNNDCTFSRKSSIAPTDASTPTEIIHSIFTQSSDPMEGILSPNMSERETSDARTPSKRQRTSPDNLQRTYDVGRVHSRQDSIPDGARQAGYFPNIDPFLEGTSSLLSKKYLECFLQFVNVPTFEIFPPRRFRKWAIGSPNKSLSDRMMLYAMMAWGTLHSDDEASRSNRSMFKQVVYQALDEVEASCCVQTVHMLLFLTFAEFADGQHEKQRSLFARCVGVLAALQLNVEKPMRDVVPVYGFSPSMSAECLRRTYWAVHCSDAFAGLAKGDPRALHNTDVFLRLPCEREMYEEDRIPVLPVCDHESLIPATPATQDLAAIGNMAWLSQIASICSEVQLNSWRCQNHLRINNRYIQDSHVRHKLGKQLTQWANSYNDGIQAKEGRSADTERPASNVNDSAARAKKFAGLDILFHYAYLEMSRRIYHRGLGEQELLFNTKTAYNHATETLKFAQQILSKGGQDTRDHIFVSRGPLTGYCLHAAIDVITAAGKTTEILEPNSSIMRLLYSALELLEELGKWWGSAKVQYLQVKERVQLVFNSARVAADQRKQFFSCSDAMVQAVDTDFDLIYGTDRKQYIRVMYNLARPVTDEEVFYVNTRERDSLTRVAT